MAEPAARREPSPARSRPRPGRRPLEPAARRGAARRPAPLQRAGRGRRRDRAEHPHRPPSPPRARTDRRLDAVPAAPAADVVLPDCGRPGPRLGAAAPRRLGRPRHARRRTARATARAARRSRPAGTARPARSSSTAPTPTRRAHSRLGRPPAAPGLHSARDGRRALGTRHAGPRPAGRARPAPTHSAAASLQGLPPRSVPEVAPTPLQRHYINLSVIVLICGAIAITALELGTPLGSPLVKLCVVIAAPLLVVTTADAVLRIWRSAWAWMPVDRGQGRVPPGLGRRQPDRAARSSSPRRSW